MLCSANRNALVCSTSSKEPYTYTTGISIHQQQWKEKNDLRQKHSAACTWARRLVKTGANGHGKRRPRNVTNECLRQFVQFCPRRNTHVYELFQCVTSIAFCTANVAGSGGGCCCHAESRCECLRPLAFSTQALGRKCIKVFLCLF